MLRKCLLLMCLTVFVQARVVIWDFGGVLFEPNKFGVARHIGLKYFISYLLFDQKNPNVQQLIFDVLARMEKQSQAYNKQKSAGTAEGVPLPPIMCQWQAGTVTGYDIIKRSRHHIKALAKKDYFVSKREQILVARTIGAMFDPEVLARNIDVIPAGLDLLKASANARYADGRKRNINIGFSNWDPLSFEKFKQIHKEAFQYFDHIIISGDIGLIKPHQNAYDYVITNYNLNPHDCVLIDDQAVNTKGATTSGIKTIRLKKNDYYELRRKLIFEGVLSAND